MPLFSDPLEPPSLKSAGKQLLRHSASLLALMGWATLSLGLANTGSRAWWIGLPGFVASLVGRRYPVASAVSEITLLAAGLALFPTVLNEWGLVGASLVLVARGIHLTLSFRERGA